jgi:hypothetical protein
MYFTVLTSEEPKLGSDSGAAQPDETPTITELAAKAILDDSMEPAKKYLKQFSSPGKKPITYRLSLF